MNYIKTILILILLLIILSLYVKLNNSTPYKILICENYIVSFGFFFILCYMLYFLISINIDKNENFDNTDIFDNFIERPQLISQEAMQEATQEETHKKINCDEVMKNLEILGNKNIITLPSEYKDHCENVITQKYKVVFENKKVKNKQYILRTLINKSYYYLVMTINKKNDLPEHKGTKEKPEACNIGEDYILPMLVSETVLFKNYKPENYHFYIIKRKNTYVLSADINNITYYISGAPTLSPYVQVPTKPVPQFIGKEVKLLNIPNHNSLKFLCGMKNTDANNPFINFHIESNMKPDVNPDLTNTIMTNLLQDKNPEIFKNNLDIFIKDNKDRKFSFAVSLDLDDPLKLDRIPLCIMPIAYDECTRNNEKCNKTIHENGINYAGTSKISFEIISVIV